MKIKLMFIITGLNTGGAEMMLYKTIKNINRSKFEPVVVSLLPEGVVADYIKGEDVTVYSLNFKGIKGIFSSIIKLRQIIKNYKPVIIHSYMFHADIVTRILGKTLKVPIIISAVRNENIGGKNRELLMRLTDKWTDCVTVICKKAACKLIKEKVIKSEKTKVIYNGVELDKFNINVQNTRKSKEFNILSIGRLHAQKNYPLLVESVAVLVKSYPNIKVSIAGEGENREEIQALIKSNELENHIELLGRRDDIISLLKQSDLFVLPSSWEGMPNVVLEAMAASKPVVATNVGGTSEIIRDQKSGILVPPNNKAAMINSIEKIINMDNSQRELMGKEGRKIIKEKFDINRTIKETEKLYSFLISEKLGKKI